MRCVTLSTPAAPGAAAEALCLGCPDVKEGSKESKVVISVIINAAQRSCMCNFHIVSRKGGNDHKQVLLQCEAHSRRHLPSNHILPILYAHCVQWPVKAILPTIKNRQF